MEDLSYSPKFNLRVNVESPSTLGAEPSGALFDDIEVRYQRFGHPTKIYYATGLLDLVAQNTPVASKLNARNIVWERFVLIALGAVSTMVTGGRPALKHYLDKTLDINLHYE